MRSLRNFSKVAMSSTLSSTGWLQSMVYLTRFFFPPFLPFAPTFCRKREGEKRGGEKRRGWWVSRVLGDNER